MTVSCFPFESELVFCRRLSLVPADTSRSVSCAVTVNPYSRKPSKKTARSDLAQRPRTEMLSSKQVIRCYILLSEPTKELFCRFNCWFSRVKVHNFHLCAKKIGEKITFQTFSHRFFPFLFGIISPFSPYFSKERFNQNAILPTGTWNGIIVFNGKGMLGALPKVTSVKPPQC